MPITPAIAPKMKYRVPISLWLVENSHRVIKLRFTKKRFLPEKQVVLTFLYEECRTLVSCGWLLTNRKHGKKKKKGGGEGPESPHFIDGGHFDPLVDQARSH